MKHLLFSICTLLAVCLALSSCRHHHDDDPNTTPTVITVTLDREAPALYKTIEYAVDLQRTETDGTGTANGDFPTLQGYSLRLTYEIYEGNIDHATSNETQLIERRTNYLSSSATNDSIHTLLPKGDYFVLVFADYVTDTDHAPVAYDNSSLTHIIPLSTTPTDIRQRACLAGNCSLSALQGATAQATVTLASPTARLRFVATDTQEFLSSGGNINDLSVKINYKNYIATGINLATMELEEIVSEYALTFPLVADNNQNELSFVADYPFADTQTETNVTADICVTDGNGKEISRFNNIRIPFFRNKETRIKACFLTQSTGGGIPIDEDFSGEHVVPYNE